MGFLSGFSKVGFVENNGLSPDLIWTRYGKVVQLLCKLSNKLPGTMWRQNITWHTYSVTTHAKWSHSPSKIIRDGVLRWHGGLYGPWKVWFYILIINRVTFKNKDQ